jgi:hypothetical protein
VILIERGANTRTGKDELRFFVDENFVDSDEFVFSQSASFFYVHREGIADFGCAMICRSEVVNPE